LIGGPELIGGPAVGGGPAEAAPGQRTSAIATLARSNAGRVSNEPSAQLPITEMLKMPPTPTGDANRPSMGSAN
jgi:hypothetical protein